MSDHKFYASDAEDNHEDPWQPQDGATTAREAAEFYAWEQGMEPDPTGEFGEDLVYVIEASKDGEVPDGWGDVEERGWPLTEHGRWCFRIVGVRTDGVELEEVDRG